MAHAEDMLAYYDQGAEAVRLADWGRLEALRTHDLPARHLPPPPADVLDVGGGAGAYAAPLRDRGYRVRLIDPVTLHVEQARAAGLDAVRGDARALAEPDGGADVALLLGPLYHLQEPGDRAAALSEARRVLRPGGLLVAAAISRFASAIDGVTRELLLQDGFEPMMAADLATGRHENPGRVPDWFTTAYFHRPDELRDEVVAAGFPGVRVLAVEGPFGTALDAWLDGGARQEQLLRTIRRVEGEPALLGASPHLVAIATRP